MNYKKRPDYGVKERSADRLLIILHFAKRDSTRKELKNLIFKYTKNSRVFPQRQGKKSKENFLSRVLFINVGSENFAGKSRSGGIRKTGLLGIGCQRDSVNFSRYRALNDAYLIIEIVNM